jgi:hypothetical protein
MIMITEAIRFYFLLNPNVVVFAWWLFAVVAVVLFLGIREKIRKNKNSLVRLSFSSFSSFYDVSAKGWDISQASPRYYKEGKVFKIAFSPSDRLKFAKWKKEQKKIAEDERETKRALQFTKFIREDIQNSFPNVTIKR